MRSIPLGPAQDAAHRQSWESEARVECNAGRKASQLAYFCCSASCSSLPSTNNSCCIRQVLDAGVARVTWKQGKRHAHQPCELGYICHVRFAHRSPCGPSLRQYHHCLQGVQSYARAALHTIVDFSKVFECSAGNCVRSRYRYIIIPLPLIYL